MILCPCEAVLFDLDGVLVNSAACIAQVLTTWANRHRLSPSGVIRAAHGRRIIETIRLVAPHLDADREASAMTALESVTTAGIVEVPGARDILASLPTNRWAIVTSGARAVATLRLSATGLPMPHVLIAAEDVAHGKPDPEGYLAAAKRLGVAPDACIVVEDAPAGIAAARAAGMRAVGIAGTFAADALTQATHVIASLSALHITRGASGESFTVHLAPA